MRMPSVKKWWWARALKPTHEGPPEQDALWEALKLVFDPEIGQHRRSWTGL